MIEEMYQTKELDSSKQKNRPHVSTKSFARSYNQSKFVAMLGR